MKNLSKLTILSGALLAALASSYSYAEQSSYGTQPSQPSTMPTPAGQPATNAAQPGQQSQTGLKTFTPDAIQWTTGPKSLPAGAQYVVLDGNPKAKSGEVTVRIKVPANYQIPPHYFPNNEKITIISGTLNAGAGDKLDTSNGTALPAGTFVIIPAKKHLYVWASEDAVVQLTGPNPSGIKYVNPNDDPRKHPAALQTPSSQPSGQQTPPANTQQPNPQTGM